MEPQSEEGKFLLAHHEQQPLCTTRLPYRQGRKLTAVKTYTVNNESKHLLIFGVPSLNLRQETKALLSKFGNVLQLTISKKHKAEVFTETFHAVFENIQSARVAKKMLDAKNFYGGVLHICYAPEFESLDDTRQKLELRRRDIFLRLKNLAREKTKAKQEVVKCEESPDPVTRTKLNMGELNIFSLGTEKSAVTMNSPVGNNQDWFNAVRDHNSRKRKSNDGAVIEKPFKPCFVTKEAGEVNSDLTFDKIPEKDIVDLTSVDIDTVTNIDIDKTLNFSNFGKELIKKVPPKPVNVIKFHSTTSNNKTVK